MVNINFKFIGMSADKFGGHRQFRHAKDGVGHDGVAVGCEVEPVAGPNKVGIVDIVVAVGRNAAVGCRCSKAN